MTTRDEIYATLCRLLQPFNTNDVELSPTTEISADLSIDSVSVMDFVMEVEDHFEIDIPLNVLSETRTMDELVSVVETRLKQKAPS
ncbi:MAG: acyl carrier protein [Hyphomicrobiales bacterium]